MPPIRVTGIQLGTHLLLLEKKFAHYRDMLFVNKKKLLKFAKGNKALYNKQSFIKQLSTSVVQNVITNILIKNTDI